MCAAGNVTRACGEYVPPLWRSNIFSGSIRGSRQVTGDSLILLYDAVLALEGEGVVQRWRMDDKGDEGRHTDQDMRPYARFVDVRERPCGGVGAQILPRD